MSDTITNTDADLLYGMDAVAEFMGIEVDQARHLAKGRTITTFKIGKMRCARKSTIRREIAAIEAAAGAPTEDDEPEGDDQ